MRGIRKRFGATLALDGVDLAVAAGEACALVGQNGAGKSTLMAVLAGALEPDAGTLALDGVPYRPRNPLDARRAGVAMIHQEPSLAPDLSVAENVLLGAEPARFGILARGRLRSAAREALARLGHAEIALERVAGTLSPGEQQVVEIARALALGSRVLVLDEPTSRLGREDVGRLFALVARLAAEGHAVVYISHFLEEVKQVASRFVVLRDGRNAGGGATAQATAQEMVGMMVGRPAAELYSRTPREPGPPLLELAGFGPGAVELALREGEVLGIAGLLGAGRTELLRMLFGLDPVLRGTVRLGVHAGFADPRRRWAQGMGYLSEDRAGEGLAGSRSVAENLTLSKLEGLGPGPLVLPRRQDAAASRWGSALGIRCRGPRQPVAALSGGNQQKVALARLLYHDVDVLVLDEPTRGIDVASKAQLYARIDALVSEARPGRPRRAVLMASSDMAELLGLCDRVTVMHRGRLGPARPAAQLDEHRLVLEATGTGDAA
jgi:ribose transport system ATP-binding protein